jgi:hypothetical protein
MSITIGKDQKKRLETFADYCKKSEGFCPINDHNLFYVKDGVMEVYALGDSSNGGAGCLDIKIDVGVSGQEDGRHFVADVQKITGAIKKVKNDDVTLSIERSKVVVKNPAKDKNFVSVTTFPEVDDEAITEARTMIDIELGPKGGLKDHASVTIDEKNRKLLETFGELTKLLDVNDSFEIGPDSIKAADNLGIVKMTTDLDQIVDRSVVFNRNVAGILKFADSMLISDDGKYQFVGLGGLGIRIFFAPKLPRWQYPSDQEISDIRPESGADYVFKVKGKDLVESIDQFDGTFDSQAWRYHQVKVRVSGEDTFDLHYDDMATEINEELSCSDMVNSTGEDEIELILPTLHITKLRDYLVDESLEISLNGLEVDDNHGAAILIKTPTIELTVGKLLP